MTTRGRGRPRLPVEDQRIMFAVRLHPTDAARLRRLTARFDQSQPTVISAALKIMESQIEAQDRLTE